MNTELLIIFIVLNVVNVIIQTVKSILTIKGGKWTAALVNAIAYGLYTVVVVYMVCDLPLMLKAGIIAAANLIGVYVVKLIEEKKQKDKLWKVEATVNSKFLENLDYNLTNSFIPHSFVKLSDKHTLFNCYCATKEESKKVKELFEIYEAKFFVSESKNLY